METYLPLINSTIAQLYKFTLDNPLYAATIALLVWFLMAIFYSIRIAILNRRNRLLEQTRIEAQANLEATSQQLQQNQEELAAITGQLDQEKTFAQQQGQRLNDVEAVIAQRNKQVFGVLQNLSTQLDLGERPIPVSEDIRSDDLWQQHDRIIQQLLERLRSEQQAKTELKQAFQTETAKVAEKDVLMATMRTTLDLQTNQLASLEASLAEQKLLLQQQSEKAQATIAEFKVEPAATPTPVYTQAAEPVASAPEQVSFFTPQADFQPAKVLEEAVQVVQSAASQAAAAVQAAPKPAAPVQASAEQPGQSTEPAQNSNLVQDYIELGLADAIYPKASPEPVSKDKAGVAGKLKGLFGKKSAAAPKPEKPVEAVQPEKTEAKKLKGWLGKLTTKK